MLAALLGVCLVALCHSASLTCHPKWLMTYDSTVHLIDGQLYPVENGKALVNPDNGYPKVLEPDVVLDDARQSKTEVWNLWTIVQGSDEQQAASISRITIMGIPVDRVSHLEYKSVSGQWEPVSTSLTTIDTIILHPPIRATALRAKPDKDVPSFRMDVYGCAEDINFGMQ